jgi:tetraacyldisaccharide 4'-kinase
LSGTEQARITSQIRQYASPQTPIFFAGLQYGRPVSFSNNQVAGHLQEVVLVSGLANADPLERYVRQEFQLVKHHRFSDHYRYSREDLDRIMADLPAGAAVVTTEKDWVKLDALLTPQERKGWPLYILSVNMEFLAGNQEDFTAYLTDQYLKNR